MQERINLKNVLEKKDYDLYRIKLPPEMIFGSRRKRFLVSELGKQHPRFSDEFCFDSKLRFNKNGFFCDVVVMEKFRLSQIKNVNSHQRIFIQEKKDSFFNSGVQKVVLSPLFFVILCVLVAGIFTGKMISRHFEKTSDKSESFLANQTENGTLPETSEGSYELKKFLDTISASDGKISWLEWNIFDGYERYSASVTKIYPEVFPIQSNSKNFSSVSYVDGIPSFVVNFKNKVETQNQKLTQSQKFTENQKLETGSSVFPEIREVLKKHGATIVQENQNPAKLLFYCETNKELFLELSKVLAAKNYVVKNFSVRKKNNSVFEVQLEFDVFNLFENQILVLIGENLQLFADEKNSPVKKVQKQVNQNVEKTPGVKTGEIKYADGTKIVFYKTAEGKTIKQKE